MTFQHLVRRLHLYLAMALLPWFLMYAVTSFAFAHHDFFASFYEGHQNWTPRFDKPYDGGIDAHSDEAARKAFASRVVEEHDLGCAPGVSPVRDRKVNVWCARFFSQVRVIYDVENKRLVAEDKNFRVDHFLTGLHARGGYHHDSVLHDLWAVIVDIVCLGFILWAATGIFMWWKLPRLRRWGAVALFGGIFAFVWFMIGL